MSILGSIPEDVEETRGSEDGKKTDKTLMDCIKDAIDAKANCQIHAEVKVLGLIIYMLWTSQSKWEAPTRSGTHGT